MLAASTTSLLGPGLYLYSRDSEDDDAAATESGADIRPSWSIGVGALFGLPEASADASLRVTLAVEY